MLKDINKGDKHKLNLCEYKSSRFFPSSSSSSSSSENDWKPYTRIERVSPPQIVSEGRTKRERKGERQKAREKEREKE